MGVSFMSETGTERQEKPPSLEQYLWDAIPEEKREEFVHDAALALLKAIHPNDFARAWIQERKQS